MFNYDEKYQARVQVSKYELQRDPEIMAWARETVLRQAFLGVATKSLCEYGVNIKTIIHSWDNPMMPVTEVGAIVLVSFPKEHVMKAMPLDVLAYEDYQCVWCGAKSPKDDRFHSGTCENCGGPKL
jgi:hypothetical protein